MTACNLTTVPAMNTKLSDIPALYKQTRPAQNLSCSLEEQFHTLSNYSIYSCWHTFCQDQGDRGRVVERRAAVGRLNGR